jgi:hypothetical protein
LLLGLVTITAVLFVTIANDRIPISITLKAQKLAS